MKQHKFIDSSNLLAMIAEYEKVQNEANLLQERIEKEFFKNRNLNLNIDFDPVTKLAVAYDCNSVADCGGIPPDLSLKESAVIDFINVKNQEDYKKAIKKHENVN